MRFKKKKKIFYIKRYNLIKHHPESNLLVETADLN